MLKFFYRHHICPMWFITTNNLRSPPWTHWSLLCIHLYHENRFIHRISKKMDAYPTGAPTWAIHPVSLSPGCSLLLIPCRYHFGYFISLVACLLSLSACRYHYIMFFFFSILVPSIFLWIETSPYESNGPWKVKMSF